MRKRAPVGSLCGVDEAGRGPLAGAVFAAAVILHPKKRIQGLADSKTLTEKRREELAEEIRDKALAFAVASASVAEIDEINILQATLLAMKRAVESMALIHAPVEVMVDGLHVPAIVYASRALVDGDQLVAEISAASILAKTARDREMCDWHQRYPQYGFARHKGYGTPEHLAALKANGPCELHRKSFAPVRAASLQPPLFAQESADVPW